MHDAAARRSQLVHHLRATGEVTDERVLDAIGAVPRERFIDARQAHEAYSDEPLPIGSDQTISQPLVVALMTEALHVAAGDHVLEIGTGSGYQAAVLQELGAKVTTIERIPKLATRAAERLLELEYNDIDVHIGDGSKGWPEGSPYDGIIVTAGAPSVPKSLLEQLADGGRLVAPIGPAQAQELLQVSRSGSRFRTERLGPVAFVPLIGAEGWPEPHPLSIAPSPTTPQTHHPAAPQPHRPGD